VTTITIGTTTSQPDAGHDWRLVPSALAVWLVTMVGLLVHWWWAAIGGAATGALGIAVVLAARGGRADPAWLLRLGLGWSLVVCGLLVSLPTTLRLRDAATDPLREHAASGAFGQFRVEVDDRPRPIFSTGFGGRQGGTQAVKISARIRSAVVDGRTVDSGGTVLLIAPVDRWSAMLPGQQADLDAAVSPADPGELTVAVLRVRGPPASVSEPPPWQQAAQVLRSGLRAASAVLDPDSAALLPALVVGDTDAVPRALVTEFRTAGMAHLLAVSGANLAIVCVAVLLLLRALRVGPRGCAAGAMLALVGFVVLAGPEPSVLRAGAMGAVGLLALAIGRERAALPALCAAVILLVLHDPALAVSWGFALSAAATAGLVLLAPRWADALAGRGVPRGLAEALAVPAAAHLVTAPLVAGMAGQVSLVAVAANLLAAPVVAPATVLGVLAALLAPALPWLAEWCARLAGPEVDWLITLAGYAARLPGAAIGWPGGWWGGLSLCALTVAGAVALRHRRLRIVLAAALAGMLLVLVPVRVIAPGWPPPSWTAVACDVGQGDALVLATAEPGRAVVVDTGPEPGPVRGCLDRLDVDRVPLVILSHLHADHVGGLAGVLADRAVGAVAVGPTRLPGWAWQQVQGSASREGVPVVGLAAGQRLTFPGLTIDVLAPVSSAALASSEADGTEVNNSSLVLAAETRAGRLLLTGDIELAAQADLLAARAALSAEVVKVPHHGSRYISAEFLAATSARIALVSAGAGNRYGHPSPATINALQRRGTLVVRTDTGGDSAIVPDVNGPTAVSRGVARVPSN
jgi:competence protein ComEC